MLKFPFQFETFIVTEDNDSIVIDPKIESDIGFDNFTFHDAKLLSLVFNYDVVTAFFRLDITEIESTEPKIQVTFSEISEIDIKQPKCDISLLEITQLDSGIRYEFVDNCVGIPMLMVVAKRAEFTLVQPE